MRTARCIILLALCPPTGCQAADRQNLPAELYGVRKTTTVIDAFRPTPEFDRHDPSNIIRHEDRFWVFYTRNIGDHREVSVRVASSSDGYQWTDLGEALGRGPKGSWDESGTIAPYVVAHDGKVYLFYTGFRAGDLATRELGIAIANHPSGPWTRWPGNPILRRNPDSAAWDSGMLGDSNVIFREGKWWLYFKSRRDTETNQETRIGVAVADQITGPYHKHPANPLFAGHAFSGWRHRDGVAALCGVISPKIKWSPDGLHFRDAGEMPNQSTGLFTPDATSAPENLNGFDWGLEVYPEAGARGLRRFDCMWQPPRHLASEDQPVNRTSPR
jgi:beta-xylosidase